ncbi:probable cytochrome P450 311a1 [Drosophila sulfurigaster albostrigata]|uniref:probable cytochrome P450 311a1 n=1 Tax=Drosophila sulfurigaster albostrigata TaxID=89887 RepID=UPI002D21D9EC|nr:probable cytochrome P450 311a1 [Drosophila sulfurigaster albostrigata]
MLISSNQQLIELVVQAFNQFSKCATNETFTMALLWLLFSLVFVLLLVWSKRELIFLGSSLAGPWALPLLGNAQMVGKLKPEFIFLVFTELRERFNDTYRLWLGPQLWVFLHTAEETQQALHDPTLLKADTFQQLSPLIGNGLLISHGRYWATQRRLMTPAFQPQLLRSFAPAVAKHADRLLVRLQQTKGVAIEVTDHLFACLLDAIVDTSMGHQLNTQEQQHSPIVSAFHRSGVLLFKRMINPMLASDFVFKRTALWRELSAQLDVIHTLMEGVIEQRAKQLKQEEEQEDEVQRKPRILLDALLLAPLSRQQIRDEVNTFVFAGVDTTTASMGFVLYALAKYPNVQRRLHVEVAKLPPGGASNLDALNQLVYLDALIKEVLRHYTIVPSTGRQTTKTTTIGGRRYCAGVTLWINMYGLAHDASYFAAPYEFNPDRWLADEQHKETPTPTPPPPPPYSYIPFSGGPHVCIGRKYSLLLMKLLTVRIVDSFHLQLGDPLEEPVLMAQMVLRFRDGINIKFLPRNVEE